MEQVRVSQQDVQADVNRFRHHIDASCRGNARSRPKDCTGRRFLVRNDFYDSFTTLAERFGLRVEREHS